ncbi:hypothetical protein OHS33_06180 [Streptomyces sp. NBC_00536]|uniref:hypothetical protein n=1 Tax=Streptomyces sp. NBC_00536 TaxID=2975769 RepID=UPI002E7FEEFC|nr:hypothetical protein [Streptomyces sp. NBC_00536]WUC77963.1 hypothetical protein OHS33_06180 [Streptomyces sp. NBC_00536]
MQNTKRAGRTAPAPHERPEPQGGEYGDFDQDADFADFADFDASAEAFDIHHAVCPDCSQSIALVADEEFLPEHGLCLSPWNPFGLTVCAGTGRPATDAREAAEAAVAEREAEQFTVLTLPQGLDWRTQPFSHVGGPGSRPVQHVQAA